eukprot:scaffold2818_cov141-Isochrysis_galbana.AAC.1
MSPGTPRALALPLPGACLAGAAAFFAPVPPCQPAPTDTSPPHAFRGHRRGQADADAGGRTNACAPALGARRRRL